MSAVKDGRYSIHLYEGPGIVGGSYATVDEINKPVKLWAMGPKSFDQQEWLITYGNEDGKSRIFSTFNGSLMSTVNPAAVPSGPVIAFIPGKLPSGGGPGPVVVEQNWVIRPVAPGSDICTIQPATTAVGMDYHLGHDGVDMVIQAFDIRDPGPRPQWELSPCK